MPDPQEQRPRDASPAPATGTDDIRQWAMALPEVEETNHFRLHVPVFKVGGRTFVGLGKDETTAVFCVSEQEADNAATADPDSCAAVRRQDARRSFLGLEVNLGDVDAKRIRDLVERAWRQQAPKKLVAQRDRDASPS
ncbi:MmcQ/YjbR family DNA-binding protein [Rugosimonospora africana]|uniref:MmcQ/YjbR family DNA-binding protein n=1 Tax=Rugosimonospora africana TaxID=556532 RepID=UPI0019421F2E|nr:MmcQ/YjbR family DNA-binding protein [Rugosimonospora africana]